MMIPFKLMNILFIIGSISLASSKVVIDQKKKVKLM